MKRKIVTLLTVISISLCVPCNAKVVKAPSGFYPHMGVVSRIKKTKNNYFKVTFRDAEGRKWSWIDDDPSWCRGDFVATIMYDNGTRTVYDDQVVDARYVGCKKMF